MIDETKLYDEYPKELIKKMRESRVKEYPTDYAKNDPIGRRDQESIRAFKEVMEGLTGSQLPRKVELQLKILEDIIMNFLTPYTRQLLLTRISKQISDNKVLEKYESYEESLE
ncbi:MAG: hypothetical protein ACFFB3_19145 [Candidatus Hodarchaeota archaeon]